MKRCEGVSGACIFGAGLLTALVAAAPAKLYAQSADLVLCDRVAADPIDPDKPADVKGATSIAPADVAVAIKYCKVAALSSRRALYQLGRAYAANQQMKEAAAAYRKAVDKGSSAAMVELGALLTSGTGVPKDEAQGRQMLQRAAAAGNPRAAVTLANTEGGTPSDPVEARALLEKAAATNSAEAQFQLGVMYAEGTGGPPNDAAARAMFDKAAAQGHAQALDWMGAFVLSGRGGPQDTAAAKAYYEKAAALGNEDAKAALERLKCTSVIKDKRGNIISRLCF